MRPVQISRALYVSGNGLRTSREDKERIIRNRGIGLVINLWRDDPDWGQLDVFYVHAPIGDGRSIPTGQLDNLAEESVALWNTGGSATLVLCQAGRNRSCLLAALIVRKATGVSGREALFHVRAMRPRAIANPAFAAYLESLP